MTDIILSGCNGKMGRVIAAAVAGRCDCRIVAGFDIHTESQDGFPVYANPQNCPIAADVIIDFSHPSALAGVLTFAKEHHMPVVIATTGTSEEQQLSIRDCAKEIPVFFTANMSIGVNLVAALAKQAAMVLGDNFDVEILEKHHNQKVDAPSGTALMLADAVSQGLSYTPEYVYDRHSVRQKRDKNEIGFASIRGGTIVGEHEIIFAGHDEVVTITHQAMSKEIFAVGAVNAALFVAKQPVGLYDMESMLKKA